MNANTNMNYNCDVWVSINGRNGIEHACLMDGRYLHMFNVDKMLHMAILKNIASKPPYAMELVIPINIASKESVITFMCALSHIQHIQSNKLVDYSESDIKSFLKICTYLKYKYMCELQHYVVNIIDNKISYDTCCCIVIEVLKTYHGDDTPIYYNDNKEPFYNLYPPEIRDKYIQHLEVCDGCKFIKPK